MCPKLIGRFHSELAQMLDFIDNFQLVPVSFHVVRLLQGFWSMDLIIAGSLISQIRPGLHILVLDICAIVVRVFFFGVGGGFSGSRGGFRLWGVPLSHS